MPLTSVIDYTHHIFYGGNVSSDWWEVWLILVCLVFYWLAEMCCDWLVDFVLLVKYDV